MQTNLCKVEGCNRKHHGLGFCDTHYNNFKDGIIDANGKKLREFFKTGSKRQKQKICKIEGCGRITYRSAFGFCHKHYIQYHRFGILDMNGKQLRPVEGHQVCKICGKKYFAKGFCRSHYHQFLRGNLGKKCQICGWDRGIVDICHIIPVKETGIKRSQYHKDNGGTLYLCPNHHRLFDRGLLTVEEKEKIKEFL